MDDALPVDNQHNNQAPFLQGINKYLVVLLVFFIFTALVILVVYFLQSKPTINSTFTMINKDETKNTVNKNTAQSTTAEQNQPAYQFLVESRFQGRIISAQPLNTSGGVHLELQSVTPDTPYPTAIYDYEKVVLERFGLTQFVASLQINNRVDIIEWTDLAAAKDNGLVALLITRPQHPPDTPYNQWAFEFIKKQLKPQRSAVYERAYTGKITALSLPPLSSTLELKLNRDMADKVISADTFQYTQTMIDKTVLQPQQLAKLPAFADLKVGDKITIIEANDYSKNYEDSVLKITINKL